MFAWGLIFWEKPEMVQNMILFWNPLWITETVDMGGWWCLSLATSKLRLSSAGKKLHSVSQRNWRNPCREILAGVCVQQEGDQTQSADKWICRHWICGYVHSPCTWLHLFTWMPFQNWYWGLHGGWCWVEENPFLNNLQSRYVGLLIAFFKIYWSS